MTDTTLNTLLARIRAQARRLHDAEHVALIDAYDQAIVAIIMAAAEEQALEAFEAALIEAVRCAQNKKGGRPVRRSEIMIELDLLGMGRVDEWTVWKTASLLEERTLIYRPGGRTSRLWAVAA